MDGPHFHFGFHPEHGLVARATTRLSPHLADWYLTREQFEQIPRAPHLYRLTQPEQDGTRRSRQAVADLRAHGFTVHTDGALDPAVSPPSRQPAVREKLTASRNPRAQAAAARSPQRGQALTTEPATTARPERPAAHSRHARHPAGTANGATPIRPPPPRTTPPAERSP